MWAKVWSVVKWVLAGIGTMLVLLASLAGNRKGRARARQLEMDADSADSQAAHSDSAASEAEHRANQLQQEADKAKEHREEVEKRAEQERSTPAGGSKSDVDDELSKHLQ
jgi:hypothetical protein